MAFKGLEPPNAMIDECCDGLASIQKLNDTLAKQREEANEIIESQTTLPTRIETEISSASNFIDKGEIANAY